MSFGPFRRVCGALGALAILVSVASCSAPRGAAPTPMPSPSTASNRTEPGEAAKAAESWLVGQLADGTHLETTFGDTTSPDPGLSIDAAWAAVAVGDSETATTITGWVAASGNAQQYVGDGVTRAIPAAIAKLGLLLSTPGLTPPASGAVTGDQLQGWLTARLGQDGRFTDKADQDYSTPMGQSLAVLYLAKTGGLTGLAADPVAFLADAACDDGGFPGMFDDPAGCAGEVDTTAVALQALEAGGGHDAEAAAARDWLVAQQGGDGRWQGFGAPSVNSTALAAGVLHGEDDPAARTAASRGGTRWRRGSFRTARSPWPMTPMARPVPPPRRCSAWRRWTT
jgi:hypothetical protein